MVTTSYTPNFLTPWVTTMALARASLTILTVERTEALPSATTNRPIKDGITTPNFRGVTIPINVPEHGRFRSWVVLYRLMLIVLKLLWITVLIQVFLLSTKAKILVANSGTPRLARPGSLTQTKNVKITTGTLWKTQTTASERFP